MRAFARYSLASLATAAAIFAAGTSAANPTGGHVSAAAMSCPAGTHWDHTLLMCVPD